MEIRPDFLSFFVISDGPGSMPDWGVRRLAQPRSRSPVHTQSTKGWFCL